MRLLLPRFLCFLLDSCLYVLICSRQRLSSFHTAAGSIRVVFDRVGRVSLDTLHCSVYQPLMWSDHGDGIFIGLVSLTLVRRQVPFDFNFAYMNLSEPNRIAKCESDVDPNADTTKHRNRFRFPQLSCVCSARRLISSIYMHIHIYVCTYIYVYIVYFYFYILPMPQCIVACRPSHLSFACVFLVTYWNVSYLFLICSLYFSCSRVNSYANPIYSLFRSSRVLDKYSGQSNDYHWTDEWGRRTVLSYNLCTSYCNYWFWAN